MRSFKINKSKVLANNPTEAARIYFLKKSESMSDSKKKKFTYTFKVKETSRSSAKKEFGPYIGYFSKNKPKVKSLKMKGGIKNDQINYSQQTDDLRTEDENSYKGENNNNNNEENNEEMVNSDYVPGYVAWNFVPGSFSINDKRIEFEIVNKAYITRTNSLNTTLALKARLGIKLFKLSRKPYFQNEDRKKIIDDLKVQLGTSTNNDISNVKDKINGLYKVYHKYAEPGEEKVKYVIEVLHVTKFFKDERKYNLTVIAGDDINTYNNLTFSGLAEKLKETLLFRKLFGQQREFKSIAGFCYLCDRIKKTLGKRFSIGSPFKDFIDYSKSNKCKGVFNRNSSSNFNREQEKIAKNTKFISNQIQMEETFRQQNIKRLNREKSERNAREKRRKEEANIREELRRQTEYANRITKLRKEYIDKITELSQKYGTYFRRVNVGQPKIQKLFDMIKTARTIEDFDKISEEINVVDNEGKEWFSSENEIRKSRNRIRDAGLEKPRRNFYNPEGNFNEDLRAQMRRNQEIREAERYKLHGHQASRAMKPNAPTVFPAGTPENIIRFAQSTYTSQNDLKRAYKKIALKYHPTRSTDPRATEFFQIIEQKYSSAKI